MTAVLDLQKAGVKFFVDAPCDVAIAEFIPVFHRWIQNRVVPGLLIDVADYGHVPEGPGVLLVAHEGNYAIDLGGSRMGLLYQRKQPVAGAIAERLASLFAVALEGCGQLEAAPELGGRLRFRGEEFLFVANDRLLAPNDDLTYAALWPHLSGLAARLYDDAEPTVQRERDPKGRFAVSVRSRRPVGVKALGERLRTRPHDGR